MTMMSGAFGSSDAMPGGRFRRDTLLKRAGGIDTYSGVDVRSGVTVVTRQVTTSADDEASQARVMHEASVLRALETNALRAPIWAGREDGCFFVVRRFVEGASLDKRLRRGALPIVSALRIAIDVLEALHHAHDHDVLHRNLKPANVIVTGAGEEERAVLIDFGLARSPAHDPSARGDIVGAARYLAPEAFGALERSIDARSDLYAVGVLVFESVAGRPPFEGTDVGKVLRQHLSTPPPSLRALRADVPRALDAVVQRLLRKDPDERYQSADAVLADLDAILNAIGRGMVDPGVVIGLQDRRQALAEPALVGRVAELAELTSALERARAGRGGLVLLEAESGGGKTHLLDEFAQRTQHGAWVLRGGGVDQHAQRPFELLAGVVRDVARRASEPELRARLAQTLGERAMAVVSALPSLAPALGGTGLGDLGPEAHGEERTLAALTALLDTLGTEAKPALLLLDDCQWADEAAVRLLARWQKNAAVSGSHVIVVAAFRTEEVPADHPLRLTTPIASIALAPFGRSDLRNLAESMAGTLPQVAIDTIEALSEGSPFMAAAVLRGLVETGALVGGPAGWQVDDDRLADAQTSRRAALFLMRRFDLLAPATLELLSCGALLGKEFDLHVAAELCSQDLAEATVALSDAVERRIVWPPDSSGRVRLLHDKLREVLLSRLSDVDRAERHLHAARLIEAADSGRVFELAYHFDAAHRADLALPYALKAAELARARHALEIALANYRIAQDALDELSAMEHGAVRAQVAEALGDVLTLKGLYPEATQQLESALSHASTDFARATVKGKLGDVAFKRGDQRLARSYLEEAVRELGGRLPRSAIGFTVALVFEVFVQAAHTIAPRWFLARRAAGGRDREFQVIRLYSHLAYVYWFSAGKVACAWAHLREMNMAERYPPSAELAQAYSEHAPVMTMAPWFSRGLRYAGRSLAIRTELGDVWGQGQSLNFHGVSLHAASRHRDAIDKLSLAVKLLDQTGDRWEANTAKWNIAFAHYRLGELTDAVRVARELYATAVEIGDGIAARSALSVWARASAGQIPAALIDEQRISNNEDAQSNADVHLANGVRLLGRGEFAGAVDAFENAALIVRRSGLRQEYVAPVLPWLATALRRQAEATGSPDRRGRDVLLRRARRSARRGWLIALSYRNNLPHALRERGLLAAIAGRRRRATRLLARSIAVAATQGARYELLLSRQAWAQLGMGLNGRTCEEVLRETEAELAVLAPVAPPVSERSPATAVFDQRPEASLSLADRFSALLDVGRSIAAASTVEAVYSTVVDGAVNLLRGDRCSILDVTTAELRCRRDVTFGEAPGGISSSLVRAAVAAGRPILLTDHQADPADSDDGIVLADLRSALCAPIASEDRVVACLYVSHASIGGLFGRDEVQVAEFVTALAGAALDHIAVTEARFRSFEQHSSDVITVVDRLSTIVYQSAAAQRVFGLDPAPAVGTSLAEWVHPDDAGNVQEVLEAAARGEIVPLIECRVRHADGTWRDVESAVNNLLSDHSVNGLVLNTRDITERKQAVARLRETLASLTQTSSLLNATLDATIDGILVVDTRDRITSFNRRFLEMWQIPEQILNERDDKSAIAFMLDQLVDSGAFVIKLAELNADREAESHDLLEFKDGRVFERGSKPQRIGADVIGRVWSFRDVTEREEVEQALAEARDRAMEASRLKSEFVATTSHEIRTPMNGVIGLTGLLLETELSPVQRKYAEGVRASGEALLGLINDILDFSKIEAGKLELEAVDFDLGAALAEVTNLVSSTAEAKGLTIDVERSPGTPTLLRGDVGRLRQILLNLLSNAVKFTTDGQITIRLLSRGAAAGTLICRFEVIDAGVGISEADQARLFKPFTQADASTTRRYGGTGLGLAISARLTKAMGGRIGVDSTLGSGSTFWAEIPFERQARPAESVDDGGSDAPLLDIEAGAVLGRLLIVEDNAINQLVAREIVARLGYSCDVAANGVEALEALGRRAYAAVLMDCYMPEMDGFEATAEIRRREGAERHTPIIAMTAGAMAEDRDRCAAAGMDDYLAKPVKPSHLSCVLRQWTGAASG